MYAVIQTGGKQYRVTEGDVLRVERLPEDVGAEVSIDAVNLIHAAEDIHVGTPTVEGASVRATVVEVGRGAKVIAFKKKRRKGYRRKTGHRQGFTALRIDEIALPGKKKAKKKAKKAAKKKAKKAATKKSEEAPAVDPGDET